MSSTTVRARRARNSICCVPSFSPATSLFGGSPFLQRNDSAGCCTSPSEPFVRLAHELGVDDVVASRVSFGRVELAFVDLARLLNELEPFFEPTQVEELQQACGYQCQSRVHSGWVLTVLPKSLVSGARTCSGTSPAISPCAAESSISCRIFSAFLKLHCVSYLRAMSGHTH